MNIMKQFNVFTIAAAALAIIGVFVPYYALPSTSDGVWHRYSISLIEMEFVGIAILIFAVLMIVFSIIKKRMPLIIASVLLVLVELIFIFLAFAEGTGPCIIDNDENGTLLQTGFYIAIWVEVLSVIGIVKSKHYLKQ